jgi:glycosyltransferase involved in cell wall biosynthesis
MHGTFSTYLTWSQPFLHRLLAGLAPHVDNVVLCGRIENLEHFPLRHVIPVRSRSLLQPSEAMIPAAALQRAWRPDVLHGHFGWSAIHLLLLRQYLDRPLVVTFGGRDVAVQRTLPHFDRLYECLFRIADRIVCVSEDLRCRAIAGGAEPARTEVIRRGTDLRQFRFVDRSARDRSAPVTFLTVGRLVEKKGHRQVLAALAALREAGTPARLVVVGDGEDAYLLRRESARLGVGAAVEFRGRVPPAAVMDHLRDADVLVHCSITGADGDCEGVPNALVEAAATGLPVIATRHGGIGEAVVPERTGLLVPERDVEAMVVAMRRLATDRAERLRLGAHAGALMRARFDVADQVARHVALYEEVAAGACRGGGGRHLVIPDDLGDVARRALWHDENFAEMSLLEILEAVADAFGFAQGPRGHRARLGLLSRLDALKEALPPPVRRPIRRAFTGMVAGLLATRRGRRGFERWHERRRHLDRRALRYFGAAGLDGVDPAWTIYDLAAHLGGAEGAPSHAALMGTTREDGPRDPV